MFLAAGIWGMGEGLKKFKILQMNTEENRYQGQVKRKEIDSKGSSTIEEA